MIIMSMILIIINNNECFICCLFTVVNSVIYCSILNSRLHKDRSCSLYSGGNIWKKVKASFYFLPF